MRLNDKVYNVLKWLALVAIDAVGLFYKTIAVIWSLPYGDQIMATCTALSVLIGTLIGVSTIAYNKASKDELVDVPNEEV